MDGAVKIGRRNWLRMSARRKKRKKKKKKTRTKRVTNINNKTTWDSQRVHGSRRKRSQPSLFSPHSRPARAPEAKDTRRRKKGWAGYHPPKKKKKKPGSRSKNSRRNPLKAASWPLRGPAEFNHCLSKKCEMLQPSFAMAQTKANFRTLAIVYYLWMLNG